jgi:predicted short-subunit dehydrogenase-like oxidoreductase (DUF2520 family)
MRTLNIIGCGNVGRTLGKLWTGQGSPFIAGILNTSLDSSREAIEFIGAGTALTSINEIPAADFYLICTPDDAIEALAHELAHLTRVRKGDVVFHASGALSSKILEPLRSVGASVASVHPVKSFADPAHAVSTFDGTFCGIEGDVAACTLLSEIFQSIGAETFAVETDRKMLYHAAAVIVCNYLPALLELGVQTYAEAGLSRPTAMKIIEPIVRETVDNVFRLGTVDALTGPIARGDTELVGRQLSAVTSWNASAGELYRLLGTVALVLSKAQGSASAAALEELEELLKLGLSGIDVS